MVFIIDLSSAPSRRIGASLSPVDSIRLDCPRESGTSQPKFSRKVPAQPTSSNGTRPCQRRNDGRLDRSSEATTRRSATIDDEISRIGWAKMEIAEAQATLGNWDKAIEFWDEALGAQRKALGQNHIVISRTLTRRGRAFARGNMLHESVSDLEASISILRENLKGGKYSPTVELEIADILLELSITQQKLQESTESQRSLDAALSIRLRLLGPENDKVAEAYFLKGAGLHQNQRYREAKEAYSRALAVYSASGNPKSQEAMACVRRCASQRNMTGKIFWLKAQKRTKPQPSPSPRAS